MHSSTGQHVESAGRLAKDVGGILKRAATRVEGDSCLRSDGCSEGGDHLCNPLEAQSSRFFWSHPSQHPALNGHTHVVTDSKDADAAAGPKPQPSPMRAHGSKEGSQAPAAKDGVGEATKMMGWWARIVSRIRGRMRCGRSRERAAKSRAAASRPRSSATTLTEHTRSRTSSLDFSGGGEDALFSRLPGILSRFRLGSNLGSTDHGRGPPTSRPSTPLPRRRHRLDDRALGSRSSRSSSPSPQGHVLSLARATSSESRIRLYRAAVERREPKASPWTFMPEPPNATTGGQRGSKDTRRTPSDAWQRCVDREMFGDLPRLGAHPTFIMPTTACPFDIKLKKACSIPSDKLGPRKLDMKISPTLFGIPEEAPVPHPIRLELLLARSRVQVDRRRSAIGKVHPGTPPHHTQTNLEHTTSPLEYWHHFMSRSSLQPSIGRASPVPSRNHLLESVVNPRSTDSFFISFTPPCTPLPIRRRGDAPRDQGSRWGSRNSLGTTPGRRKASTPPFLRASRRARPPTLHRRVLELKGTGTRVGVPAQCERIRRFAPRASGKRVRFTSPLPHGMELPSPPSKSIVARGWFRKGAHHLAAMVKPSSPPTSPTGKMRRPSREERDPVAAGDAGGGGGGRGGFIATCFREMWSRISAAGGDESAIRRRQYSEVAAIVRADPILSHAHGQILPSRSDSWHPTDADQLQGRRRRVVTPFATFCRQHAISSTSSNFESLEPTPNPSSPYQSMNRPASPRQSTNGAASPRESTRRPVNPYQSRNRPGIPRQSMNLLVHRSTGHLLSSDPHRPPIVIDLRKRTASSSKSLCYFSGSTLVAPRSPTPSLERPSASARSLKANRYPAISGG
ncbi:hypothetical protein BDK51DRAFT_51804 [Blyttiomyces helicus]|uniref:Uncharacterized protein n=1 Tax=Blyttiomyces helicus TaxID=388810 RepID=A0A4P9WAV0_9FUNG|nr:hypothetical protein BDK51DRAFT_51804 [Blyttiomyces helicus]|eukprot:RKO88653.1 hypothetical protein BDK51DRAFT_51804 [Blyttiomyces helicus]